MRRKADIDIGRRAAEFIKRLQWANEWTFRDTMTYLGLDRKHWYRWFGGECPSAYALQALAIGGANINWIMTGKGEIWNTST